MDGKTAVIAFRSRPYIKTALLKAARDRKENNYAKLGTEVFHQWLIDHGYIKITIEIPDIENEN